MSRSSINSAGERVVKTGEREIGGPGDGNGVCGGRRLVARLAVRSGLNIVAIAVAFIAIVTSAPQATAGASTSALAVAPAGLSAAASAPWAAAAASTSALAAVAPAGLSAMALATQTPFAPEATPSAAPTRTLLADPPRPIREFALTTAEGKTLKLSQLSGAPVLLFFGFAHCPSICPVTLTQLRRLELSYARDLGPTRIVIISVDGERDTPAMLSEWLMPVSPTFIGLTGPVKTVHEIAAQFSAAFFKGAQQPSGDYLVEHNSQVFLLDAQGRLRASFFDAPAETMAQVTRAIAAEAR
jgi:protein SCO1/2